MEGKKSAQKTVFILDDHDIIRFGLVTLLSAGTDIQVVGSAACLTQGLADISRLKPDLVISDMSMEDSKGLDTVRAVVPAQAGRGVLVVSMHDELLYCEQALSIGANGYLMKDTAHVHVLSAAQCILNGGTWVSAAMTVRLLSRRDPRSHESHLSTEGHLTPRELEVLENLGKGKTTKEIAVALQLSTRTVDVHRSSIKRKLGLRSAVELLAYSMTRV